MGIFDRIKQAFQSSSNDPSVDRFIEEARNNQRNHERYRMDRGEVASFQIVQGSFQKPGLIKDISYGGIGLTLSDIPKDMEIPVEWQGRLTILDQTIDCPATKAHETRDENNNVFVGLSLRHETTDTLVFLRDVIENLCNGRSLEQLDRAVLSEPYNTSDWVCLRGDGPTDLRVKLSSQQSLEEFILTYRSGGMYQELTWRDGVIRTGTALNQLGPSAKMDYSPRPMPSVIRQAIYIVMALPNEDLFSKCGPVIEASLNELSVLAGDTSNTTDEGAA